ncbi:squamous cell carcinoma antigen recognized by T-cells 3-like [Plodia interpunctella]|uniref:squamous cell carcinoma antigen recognized by T-cells 3-like n=1 Tax=Plodia interpunctella TaxID=58824 RepID=UPI002368680F|nr:squamous cell carcinoma antigen recognized by T-cells 3-like [Plodia interpunctella]
MAIVEDEVRNESEEENEIEVVVEEDDADQDSDDSDDEEDEGVLESKVAELEKKISEDPYNYDEHIELIQALWTLTELDRWRNAFERLQQMTALRAEHWLLWLQTEASLAHSWESRERIAGLFKQAALDCYSIPIFTEWCSWAISTGDAKETRAQLDEVLHRAGADPFSGKLFWDAKLEFEKAQLESISNEAEEEYKAQQKRVLYCLEEVVSRPLLRGQHAWPPLQQLAAALHDSHYVHKLKEQHEAALEYLNKITPYEDKLLTTENPEDKCRIYEEYIDLVKELSNVEEYAGCDSNGILKVLYERVSTECMSCPQAHAHLREYLRLAARVSSRVLDVCARRCPRRDTFWVHKMRHAERAGADMAEVKSIFETALSKGMESYKNAEALWLAWLEYSRRRTAFDNEADVQRLRSTFRLAWDSLAEAWGEEANDCEVPLFWARLEYKRMGDPKQGKEIFEEIFRYGENKSMSKYWEALIQLESNRSPPASENKLRDLHRRALKFVTDYPPSAARLWTDFERDVGGLDTLKECNEVTEAKLKEWRDSYQAMKEKMTGKKQNQKSEKKSKFDKKNKTEMPKNKGKRKADVDGEASAGKKRKEDMEVEVKEKDGDSGGVKRSHDDSDDDDASPSKRQRTASEENARIGREACTLFVSNLEFKVNEQNLRDKLLQYGDIVSMRVKAGVKAFGGSICYCQYKTVEAVDKALKDDRTPLDGRPMFFSRYSAKKTKPTFKYATTAEKNKLFVKNLPFSYCTKEALSKVFDKYGKLSDVRVVTFKDGKPKGLAYIEYSDEASAAAALHATDGLQLESRALRVALSAPPPRAPALGLPKRDGGGGMRRTQLSSFIPSVLQKPSPSTSKANGDSDDKRPLSNSDFRTLLLKK